MKNYSKIILNSLLDKYERSSLYKGENTKDIKISFKFTRDSLADYFNEYSPEYKGEINDQCLSLKEKGYIDIQWKKFQEGNIIDKVALNINELGPIYGELKREKKSSMEERACEILLPYCCIEGWVGNFASQMKSRIENSESVKKYLDIENPALIEELMDALYKISIQQTEIPRRVFSAIHFNDSKRIERLESRLDRVMIDFGDYNGDMDILSQANIIKNPGYVYLKGTAVILCGSQYIDLHKVGSDIGLSSSSIGDMEVVSVDAKRVVTVENLTTFHSYRPDNELVIYLGGYHNETRRRFLKKVYETAKGKPFFHWGDIDLGGFRIFSHLKKRTGIPFKPLLMDVNTLIKYRDNSRPIEDKRYISELEKLLEYEEYLEFHEVIEYMIENQVRLEQEVIVQQG